MKLSRSPGFRTLAITALLLAAGSVIARPAADPAIPGVSEAQLSADYWIGRTDGADQPILDQAGVAAQNEKMAQLEPSLYDLESLPATLDRAQVQAWIEQASPRPSRTLYDETGRQVARREIERLAGALDLHRIPASQPARFGMVVRRTDVRTFPTRLRVFSSPDDRDIDRFQETALFPGTPVAVAHESRDRNWLFVVSHTYAGWVERDAVAFGDRDEILSFGKRAPFLVVTGAKVWTVYAPGEPRVSEVQLDMGVRLPLLRVPPEDGMVNGQHAYFGHAVELPVRNADGTLAFRPALVPRSADVSIGHLPLTPANILRQAFKFLGERYGWGHSYDARDCSGFVSEVYRSFGILMPRNTRDQAVSPALDRIGFEPGDDPARRQAAVRGLQVGDLVYIPGHVMMAIGHRDGMAYVIHDTNGGGWRGPDGGRVSAGLNGVSLTPLDPLLFNDEQTYVDRMTSIQRVRPRPSR